MKDYVKIPKRRLKVLRKHLKEIEKMTSCKIRIGKEIEIESEDPFMLLRVKEVIRAIGRGSMSTHLSTFLMKTILWR